MKIKKENSLLKHYKLSWKFLKESKNYVYASLTIFILFALIGFCFPTPHVLQEKLLEMIQELFAQFEGLTMFETIGLLFANNLWVSFIAIILGALFGILPFFQAVTNGYLLGFVSKIVVADTGFLVLLKLLPHGIFELPAVIVSMGFGLKLGLDMFKKERWELLRKNFKEAMRFFIFVILPLLLIAGIIEGVLMFGLG